MKLPTINKTYLILKAHFFLFQAGIAPTQTASPVYAQTLGFSSFIVGLVYTILPLLALIIKPVSGAIADKFKWHKQVMLFVEVLIMLGYFCIQFIPSGYTPPSKAVFAQTGFNASWQNGTNFALCPGSEPEAYYLRLKREHGLTKYAASCEIPQIVWKDICNSTNNNLCAISKTSNLTRLTKLSNKEDCLNLNYQQITAFDLAFKKNKARLSLLCSVDSPDRLQLFKTKESNDTNDGDDDDEQFQDDSITLQQYQFYVFLLLVLGGWGGTTVVTTLSDTICIAKCEDPHLYGKQRLWGSIGYGILSIISGLVVDAISGPVTKDYTPAFYLSLATLAIDIVMSQFLIKVKIPDNSENIAKDVWKTLLNVRVIVFIVWCMAMGVSMGLTWTFLYWLLEDLAKQQGPDTVANVKTIEGLTNGVQTFLGETPAFFFAGWVLKKIGHSRCVTVILFTIGLRFTIYSFINNPWYVLFVEPLQLYYGLFYCTMTSYANLVAKPGTQATVQSIMCAFAEGVGVAIGSFIGGILYDDYGGSMTFRIFGISFFVMAVCNEIIEFLYRFLPSEKAAKEQSEGS